MRKGLYVIYDKAADDVSSIFDAKTLPVAERSFSQAIAKTSYPEEFELWRLGWIDVEFSDIQAFVPKTRIIDAFEVVQIGKDIVDAQQKLFDERGNKNAKKA